MSGTSIFTAQGSRTLLPVTVIRNGTSFRGSALIELGAEMNFTDDDWAHERALPIYPLNPPITAQSLVGRKVMTILSITGPVSVVTSVNHQEELELYLIKSPVVPLVFCHP